MSDQFVSLFVDRLTIAEEKARLRDFVDRMEREEFKAWFVGRHSSDGAAMEDIFKAWLNDPASPVLQISGEVGAGKSTLGNYHFLTLAEAALVSGQSRIPVMTISANLQNFLRNLGSSSRLSSHGSNTSPDRFGVIGQAVVFIDGHSSRLVESDIELLQSAGAKIVILQGTLVLPDNPALARFPHHKTNDERVVTVRLSNFTLEQMREVIRKYLPISLGRISSAPASAEWRDERLAHLLSGTFDKLLTKPATAHMLCRIAADEDIEMEVVEARGQWVFRAVSRKIRF